MVECLYLEEPKFSSISEKVSLLFKKKPLFPSQLPFPLSISLNTPPPSPRSASNGSSLQTALSNPPHQDPTAKQKPNKSS